MADQSIARIGKLKHALEQVGPVSADRTREIAAVLRLARTSLPGDDLADGPVRDVADGIGAALRALADLDAAVQNAIRGMHSWHRAEHARPQQRRLHRVELAGRRAGGR